MSGRESGGLETELDRDIGIVGAIAIGIGTMIAAGIFVLSGLAVSNVGAAAIIAFFLAAIVASFTAFAYAEFSSIYTESGGGYMYVANVFDTDLTYIVGWSMILGYPASASFYLASFSDWFYRFMYPALNIPAAIPYWVSGLFILVLLVGVNLKGTEETGLFQVAVTAMKVALILLFLYGGLQAFDANVISESLAENIGNFKDIGLTSALVFITFFGFEAIATNAEEIERPGKNVPRAIFISMGLVTLIYTLVVIVVVLAVNDVNFLQFLVDKAGLAGTDVAQEFVAENGEVSMGRAAQYYLGDIGFYIIIVGALFSMVSAANATVMAGSRVKLAMSRHNHLPEQFEDLHPNLNTPYKSVLLTGFLILFYIIVFSVIFGNPPGVDSSPLFGIHLGIESIAHFADFMLLGGLIFVNFAIVQSRRKNPDADREFKVPFVPWVPIIAVLANLVLLINVEPKSLVIGLIAEAVGIGFWFGWKSRSSEAEELEKKAPTVVAEHEPEEFDYQIAVPVANPHHVEQIMRTACDIASEKNGEILVLSVVELPTQTPLSEGKQFVGDRREILEEAAEIAKERDVPVNRVVRIGHDVAHAILGTVDQHGSDAVLMGWRHRPRRRDFVLGSNVDRVITDADCDVLVEKIGKSADSVDSILVPTSGGPHTDYALEIAEVIARCNSSRINILNIVDRNASENERDEALTLIKKASKRFEDVQFETDVLEADDVADAIVEESEKHDITVIGATREGIIKQLVIGAVPEEVGRRASNIVIMTKRNLDISSRLVSWLRWE